VAAFIGTTVGGRGARKAGEKDAGEVWGDGHGQQFAHPARLRGGRGAPPAHTNAPRRRGNEEKDTKKKDPKIFIKNFSLKLEVPHTNKVQKL